MSRSGRAVFFSFLLFIGGTLVAGAPVERLSLFETIPNAERGDSVNPQISGDGSVVVFESFGHVSGDDDEERRSVYLFDTNRKTLQPVKSPLDSFSSGAPRSNDDGSLVVYETFENSGHKDLPPKRAEVILYDRAANRSEILVHELNGHLHEGECLSPAITPNARYVAFSCNATDIHPAVTIPIPQIYLIDFQSRMIELVSHNLFNDPANRLSGDPKVTTDGRTVFYKSAATNLSPPQPLDHLDFYLYSYDRLDRRLVRIDEKRMDFDPATTLTGSYDINDDGSLVVFEGRPRAPKKPYEYFAVSDLFLYDRSKNELWKITTGPLQGKGFDPAMSADGRFIVFVTKGPAPSKNDGLVVYDRNAGRWEKIVSGQLSHPRLSRNGAWIVFDAVRLPGGGPNDGLRDVYRVANTLLGGDDAGNTRP